MISARLQYVFHDGQVVVSTTLVRHCRGGAAIVVEHAMEKRERMLEGIVGVASTVAAIRGS